MPATSGCDRSRTHNVAVPAKKIPVEILVDVHERQSGIADTLRELCAFPYLLVEGTDIDRGPPDFGGRQRTETSIRRQPSNPPVMRVCGSE